MDAKEFQTALRSFAPDVVYRALRMAHSEGGDGCGTRSVEALAETCVELADADHFLVYVTVGSPPKCERMERKLPISKADEVLRLARDLAASRRG